MDLFESSSNGGGAGGDEEVMILTSFHPDDGPGPSVMVYGEQRPFDDLFAEDRNNGNYDWIANLFSGNEVVTAHEENGGMHRNVEENRVGEEQPELEPVGLNFNIPSPSTLSNYSELTPLFVEGPTESFDADYNDVQEFENLFSENDVALAHAENGMIYHHEENEAGLGNERLTGSPDCSGSVAGVDAKQEQEMHEPLDDVHVFDLGVGVGGDESFFVVPGNVKDEMDSIMEEEEEPWISPPTPRKKKKAARRKKLDPEWKPSRVRSRIKNAKASEPSSDSSEESLTPKRRRGNKDKNNNICKRVSTFRLEIGPDLRVVASVLDLTGINKNDSECLPFDLVRRFSPSDLSRTLLKALEVRESNDNNENKADATPYDWSQWEISRSHSAEGQEDFGSRFMYYQMTDEEKNDARYFSFPKIKENHGRLSYSPDVLSSLGSCELNVTLNIPTFAKTCKNIEYLGENKPLLVRIREPSCAALLFSSGRIVVTGAKSFEDFRIASRKFGRLVQKSGYNVRLTALKLKFYVGKVTLPFRVHLKALGTHKKLVDVVKYDPEVFPAAIVTLKETSVTCYVFCTGDILMTNAEKIGHLKTTLDVIYPCLKHFGCL